MAVPFPYLNPVYIVIPDEDVEPDAVFVWCDGEPCCVTAVQSVELSAGSGGRWEFRQLAPESDISAREFEVRVGFATPLVMTMAGGKVTVEGTSVFADPSVANTEDAVGAVRVELWETGSGTSLPRRLYASLINFAAAI